MWERCDISIQRVPHTKGRITEGTIRESEIGGEGLKEETGVVRRAHFTGGFDVNEIANVCWFESVHEMVCNGNNFELYALFYLEPMK